MPARRLAIALAVPALALAVLAGCGDDGETSLAIQHARRRDARHVELRTECATKVRVEVTRAAGRKPEVEIWGHPKVGRCQPSVVIRVRTDQLTDAVLVNPHDEDAMRGAIVHAIEMNHSERTRRMAALRDAVARSDVRGWADRFLADLTGGSLGTPPEDDE